MYLWTANNQRVSIVEVVHERLKYPEPFYHLCTKQHHNFVVNGVIVHNLNIRIRTLFGKEFSIDVESTNLISEIKTKIAAESGIPVKSQTLSLLGKQFDNDNLSLQDYNIFEIGKDFHLDLNITDDPSNKIIKDLKQRVVVRISNSQSFVYDFEAVRNLSVKALISIVVERPSPYFTLFYKDKFLFLDDRLGDFEPEFKKVSEIAAILVRSEKILFYRNVNDNTKANIADFSISSKEQKRFAEIDKEIQGRNLEQQYKQKAFYEPILVYSCNSVYKQLNGYLRLLEATKTAQTGSTKEFIFTSCLIQTLKKLANFVGVTHRGVRDFRFSTLKFKVGDVFNWKSFTSSSASLEVSMKFIGKCGSIFHINCLSGRDISAFSFYPKEEEVLLLPFTYFIVDRMETQSDIEEVWISEMPTPVTFAKDIILWVDDKPSNNLREIEKIRGASKDSIEILQLTSTRMVE